MSIKVDRFFGNLSPGCTESVVSSTSVALKRENVEKQFIDYEDRIRALIKDQAECRVHIEGLYQKLDGHTKN